LLKIDTNLETLKFKFIISIFTMLFGAKYSIFITKTSFLSL